MDRSSPEQVDLKQWYRSHPRRWRESRLVYPVISRRSGGLSVGINLNPDHSCNFRCIYCCVDREHETPAPRGGVDLDALQADLGALLDDIVSGRFWQEPEYEAVPLSHRHVADLAFSGEGEPTLDPRFEKIVDRVIDLKNQFGLEQAKLVLITNATRLHVPTVMQALRRFDEPAVRGEIWGKLDAGNEADFQAIAQCRVSYPQILANLVACGRQRPIVIQTMLLRREGRDPDQAFMQAFIDRLTYLRAEGCQIDRVQLYTIARPTPAAVGRIAPLSDATLDQLADQVAVSLEGVSVQRFYGA